MQCLNMFIYACACVSTHTHTHNNNVYIYDIIMYLYVSLSHILCVFWSICVCHPTHIPWSLWVAKKNLVKKTAGQKIIYICSSTGAPLAGPYSTPNGSSLYRWTNGKQQLAIDLLWSYDSTNFFSQIRKRNGEQSP